MATRFDPRTAPVIGRDEHLPAVALDRLTAQALRQRFLTPPLWDPEVRQERWTVASTRLPTAAAVLVAIVLRAEEPTVLLTQRTEHLKNHAGQVSFPGGRAETYDADIVATALREAQEEVGLPPQRVDVLGTLPVYTTGTGFLVTPVVGLVEPGFVLQTDPNEVAEAFEVPLSFLMSPLNHRLHEIEQEGESRQFYSMPWPGVRMSGESHEYFIWGATAAMLRNLYRFLVA